MLLQARFVFSIISIFFLLCPATAVSQDEINALFSISGFEGNEEIEDASIIVHYGDIVKKLDKLPNTDNVFQVKIINNGSALGDIEIKCPNYFSRYIKSCVLDKNLTFYILKEDTTFDNAKIEETANKWIILGKVEKAWPFFEAAYEKRWNPDPCKNRSDFNVSYYYSVVLYKLYKKGISPDLFEYADSLYDSLLTVLKNNDCEINEKYFDIILKDQRDLRQRKQGLDQKEFLNQFRELKSKAINAINDLKSDEDLKNFYKSIDQLTLFFFEYDFEKKHCKKVLCKHEISASIGEIYFCAGSKKSLSNEKKYELYGKSREFCKKTIGFLKEEKRGNKLKEQEDRLGYLETLLANLEGNL